MKENLKSWTLEKLRRKANQSWEMAGLARVDGDYADEKRHTKDALRYDAEIKERTNES